jgi:hypothetical protein
MDGRMNGWTGADTGIGVRHIQYERDHSSGRFSGLYNRFQFST